MGLPEICGQQNVRATARDNTGQTTVKGHTPNARIEIKIPDPTGNRTRATGLEGRNSTNLATAMDLNNIAHSFEDDLKRWKHVMIIATSKLIGT